MPSTKLHHAALKKYLTNAQMANELNHLQYAMENFTHDINVRMEGMKNIAVRIICSIHFAGGNLPINRLTAYTIYF